jgi:glc operon protein GlcG
VLLTMEQARALVDAAVEAARKRGYLISAAVVDSSGNLMWCGKMDGAKFVAPDIARAKAYTSAAFRQSTTMFEEKAAPKAVFYTGVTAIGGGRIAIGQGGLPIWMGSEFVGAIGVSGAAPPEDEEVAAAALESQRYAPAPKDIAQRAALGHSK